MIYFATFPTSCDRLDVSFLPKLVLILPTIYDMEGRRNPANIELNAPNVMSSFSFRVLCWKNLKIETVLD
jgi:hypothetical protein